MVRLLMIFVGYGHESSWCAWVQWCIVVPVVLVEFFNFTVDVIIDV